MLLYQPKPLKWKISPYQHLVTTSPFTSYRIYFDPKEKSCICHYCHHASREVGLKHGKSINGLVEWVEQTHYPSQVKKYFNEIKLEKVEKGQ